MAVEQLEQGAHEVQAALIRGQLEDFKKNCEESGYVMGTICCRIAITALSVVVNENDPPKQWSAPVQLDAIKKGGLL